MNRPKRAKSGNRGSAALSSMIKEERMGWILDRLTQDGKVLATDLTAALGVSEDTVRRDLRELAAMRRLRRVHGGALPPSPAPLSYSVRARQSVPQKKSIARAAARLIQPGSTVFLDGGTTNVHVAESLAPELEAVIITNSVPVAMVLSEHIAIEVVLIGGRLLKSSRVTWGTDAVDAIRSFRADLLLLGTCSLDAEAGITVPHLEEAPIKRAMIASAARVVGLVTAEKLGTAMRCVVAPASALDSIVTERGANEGLLGPFRDAEIEIILAEDVI